MKAALLVIVALAGCPRTLSEPDRVALQDFRIVDQTSLARAAEILGDDALRLSRTEDLAKAIESDLLAPWRAMRERVKPSDHFRGELGTILRRYFDERELAWQELAKSFTARWGSEQTVNHERLYREHTEEADADQTLLAAKLAALKLPPLPLLPSAPIVDLDAPPPVTTPGAVFFLADRTVVRLDDKGFQTIATDVDTMDVLPDGTMWACSIWHIAHWDGAHATDYKPKLPSTTCAAAPDGTLWVLNDRNYDKTSDQLGHFDGKTWKIVPAVIGDLYAATSRLHADADGRLYAVNNSPGGGSDEVFVQDKKGWREVAIPHGLSRLYLTSLFRGSDGHVWAIHDVANKDSSSTGVSRLSPDGAEARVYVADEWQAEPKYVFIDAAGAYTVLDPQRSLLVQAKKQKRLPMPAALRWSRDGAAPLALDGAGRLWVDLVDGINVIERGGKRTVYPRGSIDGIQSPVTAIAVVGAGPALVAPGAIATRTISGTIRNAGKLELMLCADDGGDPCLEPLPQWKTYSDAEGAFSFEKIPRFHYRIHALIGLSGQKHWKILDTKCCAGDAALGELAFVQDAIY